MFVSFVCCLIFLCLFWWFYLLGCFNYCGLCLFGCFGLVVCVIVLLDFGLCCYSFGFLLDWLVCLSIVCLTC